MADDHELLADLTDDQREAVTTRASPLCIMAGAGSGKTRVLTRRIAWQAEHGHVDPRRTVAVTFTRRAAGELRRRLRDLGQRDVVAAGTFHAIALAQLRRHWKERGHRPRRILERRAGFLAAQFSFLDRGGAAELTVEIGWARARLVTPDRYEAEAAAAGRRPALGSHRVAQLYADYEAAKRKRRLIDFDDVLALCHETLGRDPEFAAAQRWRHRHLFVDEFQDVNPLQFALLRAWIGDQSSVVVVGDPEQAIYGWNGADPELITDVTRHLPGCAVVHLRTNFRSTPEILAAAGRLLDRPPQPAVRPTGPEITVTVVDGAEEAVALARTVRARHLPGSAWRRQAVLARTNAQLQPLRQGLERRGIPVRSRHGSDLLERPEVIEFLEARDPRAALGVVVTDAEEAEPDPDPDRESGLLALLDLARDHLALDSEASLASFVTAVRSGDRWGPATDGVELVTFHAAKGLEWPIVHLVGIEEGYTPISHARTPASREEERRLLHVAVTRAERELHLYWCSTRVRGDRIADRKPSRWLERLCPADGQLEPVDPDRGLAAARSHLDGRSRDERTAEIRAALEAWRARIARQSRVEPASVISDLVLDELVSRRPADLADLATVSGLPPGHARRWGGELVAIVAAPRDDAAPPVSS